VADQRYPTIGDYALIGDGTSAALVNRRASIDWCCMPRVDHGSCFGRLLGWDNGGFYSLTPADDGAAVAREYLDGTLVLATTVHVAGGEARILDCFLVTEAPRSGQAELLRVVEGVRGNVTIRARIAPRFDYGEVSPWLRKLVADGFSAIGGDDALIIRGDPEFDLAGRHDLEAEFSVRAGERARILLSFARPQDVDAGAPARLSAGELDARLDATIAWWRDWSAQAELADPWKPMAVRSAIVLKALANPATGAIAAAATTSLPESEGGSLNWDYRYSWIRDSAFSVRSLSAIGCVDEADGFRRFVQRSAAGSAEELQIMYGVGGERRLTEFELGHLEGYRGAGPVRVGNAAARQLQLDVFGELAELTWRWHERGHSPDDDYWRFFLDIGNEVAERWREPDSGLWELRGEPRHFVHSKVMCWAALDRGVRLAEESLRQAPLTRWRRERDAIRAEVERRGYEKRRGIFVQAFGSEALDAALLLLPRVGFVDYRDERMIRTVDAIRDQLSVDGFLLRYRRDDGQSEPEGAFLACSFWLAECLARQARLEEATAVFDCALAASNDVGLFSEEFDSERREQLGNFPQALTHLSHIAAAVALSEAQTGRQSGH
jgi:GH15 family glucan-1,4-alpha-glucosidase